MARACCTPARRGGAAGCDAGHPQRRLLRRRLISLPIGLMMDLVLDGIWTRARCSGGRSSAGLRQRRPARARAPARCRLVLELIGVGCLGLVLAGVRLLRSRRTATCSCAPATSAGTSWHESRADASDDRAPRPHRGQRAGLLLGRLDVARRAGAGPGRAWRRDRAPSIGWSPARCCAPARPRRPSAWPSRSTTAHRARLRRVRRPAAGRLPAGIWARWRSDLDFAPPGGESLHALGSACVAFLDELTAHPTDETVVVVSHVSPIKAAVAWALGVGDEVTWRLFVRPASITGSR